MISVLLVDDHELVRAGLARLLDHEADIEVAAVAGNGLEATELAAADTVDVVLMDLSMPTMDGVAATRILKDRYPDIKIVMLTAHTDVPHVAAAIDAGALGYLAKDCDPRTLVNAVRAAAVGEAPLDPRAARVLLDERSNGTGGVLTSREQEVVALVAQGLANKQIARRLGISDKTVKAHLTRVYSSLGVSDRTQAAVWALEHGVAHPGTADPV